MREDEGIIGSAADELEAVRPMLFGPTGDQCYASQFWIDKDTRP